MRTSLYYSGLVTNEQSTEGRARANASVENAHAQTHHENAREN